VKTGNYTLLFLVFLLLSKKVFTQEILTIEQAIDTTLKNNYAIAIERNNVTIIENSNTLGNASMLPKIDFEASTNLANNNTKQEFSNGLSVDQSNVESNNITAGVYLNWILFDGFKMFATKQKLNELEAIGLLNYKIAVENTLVEVITNYYNLIKQNQIIKALLESIKVSEERLKISEKKLDLGSGSNLEVFQAKLDLNAQNSNLLRQKTILKEIKIVLNVLMARDVETIFEVSDKIPSELQLNFDEIKTSLDEKNSSISLAKRNIKIAELGSKEIKSQLYPEFNFNTNYLFSKNKNQAGFALLNQNLGLNLGFGVGWNIFNGYITSKQIKNSKLEIANNQFQFSKIKSEVHAELEKTFLNYQDELKILSLEKINNTLAQEALDIALIRFKLGSSSSIELKEIQRSYEEAIVRLTTTAYNVKVIETNLLRLNGKILK
jgi:outer membrane protein